jgi:arylamine N-acetyltransferase
MKHGGRATLNNIYAAVEKIAGEMIAKNQHWQAKVRQVLQRHFENVQRGVWAVA